MVQNSEKAGIGRKRPSIVNGGKAKRRYCILKIKLDEREKNRISDGFVKTPRSRLANPEERGVLVVLRSDEG